MKPKTFTELYLTIVTDLQKTDEYPIKFAYQYVKRNYTTDKNRLAGEIVTERAGILKMKREALLEMYANSQISYIAAERLFKNIVEQQGYITYNIIQATVRSGDGNDRLAGFIAADIDSLAAEPDATSVYY